ncbi:hypothetical protein P303_12370 [Xylella fastidiosa MUL0034]|nr:hypothetical protein P303_12370 [Xylella fastidiosa MUL0034]
MTKEPTHESSLNKIRALNEAELNCIGGGFKQSASNEHTSI